MIENIIALLLALILAPLLMALVYVVLEDEIKDFLNKRESALENISKILTPKTPIQKEIQAELKEIKRLEKQKADMERLDQLRERKERLWEEVNPKDYEESHTLRGNEWIQVSGCVTYYEVSLLDTDLNELGTYTLAAESPEQALNDAKEDFPDVVNFEIKEVMRK